MEIMRFYKQKRILHKYVRWMYDLLEDGRFYMLARSENIKDLPRNYKKEMGEVRIFERMYHCADTLSGYVDLDSGKHKVTRGFFCGDRLCPVCTIKKSLWEYSKLTWQMNNFKEDYQYYFLTLTLPNRQDGFREELDLLNSILRDLFAYIGYEQNGDRFRFCEGIFGSFEITKSDAYGWHPHLHLVLAYPKKYIESTKTVTKNIKDKYGNIKQRTFENGLQLRAGKKSLYINQDLIMSKFVEFIQKKTDVYNDRLEDLKFLNIGFQPCYNIDDGVNEMTKYLIDFEALQSADDLFVYMRDTYRFKQRVRRGCFRWTKELKVLHKQFLDEMHQQENIHFIQLPNVKPFNFIWRKDKYYAFRDFPALRQVEFTNLQQNVTVRQYLKMNYYSRGPDDPEQIIFEPYNFKITSSEDLIYSFSIDQLCLNV